MECSAQRAHVLALDALVMRRVLLSLVSTPRGALVMCAALSASACFDDDTALVPDGREPPHLIDSDADTPSTTRLPPVRIVMETGPELLSQFAPPMNDLDFQTGDGSTIDLVAPDDADADGYFEAADDEDPDTTDTIEITVALDAHLTAGSWTYEVEVLESGEVISTQSPGALADGLSSATVSLPKGDSLVYVIRVVATEAEGLVMNGADAVIVDTVAPALDLTIPSTLARTDDLGADPGIQFNATVGHVGVPQGGDLTIDDDVEGALTTLTATAGAWTNGQLTLTASGAHELTVSASDAAGNTATATASTTVSFTVPTVAVTAPADASLFGLSDDTDALTAGLQVAASVDVTGCEDGTVTVADGATQIGSGNLNSSGTATVALTVSTSIEGARTWVFTCTDSIGSASADIGVTVDLTPPSSEDLTATFTDVRRGVVHVTLNAPGDDGAVGTAASIELAWGTGSIDDATFGSSTTTASSRAPGWWRRWAT
jgi:VCBS repeat-containing protein